MINVRIIQNGKIFDKCEWKWGQILYTVDMCNTSEAKNYKEADFDIHNNDNQTRSEQWKWIYGQILNYVAQKVRHIPTQNKDTRPNFDGENNDK